MGMGRGLVEHAIVSYDLCDPESGHDYEERQRPWRQLQEMDADVALLKEGLAAFGVFVVAVLVLLVVLGTL